MFVAHFERTMRHAKPVFDAGICLRRPVVVLPRLVALPRQVVMRKPASPRPLPRYSIPAHARLLIGQIAVWHDLTPDDILGPSRKRHVIVARFDAIAAIYLNCRKSSGRYTLPDTGRAIGNRDHTTVLHALTKLGIQTRPYDARRSALDRKEPK